MSEIVQDVRYAVRGLVRTPGFAAVAVLTLALGIGANSAIFSVVDGVVLRPLPYPDPDRLVYVTSAFPTMGFMEFWVSAPEYVEYREWNRSMEEVGAFRAGEMSVTGADTPIRVQGAVVTASLFDVLEVPAARGRVLTAADDTPGADPVAVISWELWQRAFGGREDLVGSDIERNGTTTRVVGIMPPGFDLADNGIEIWVPLGLDPAAPGNRAGHYLYVVGRLRRGTDLAAARAEMGALVSGWRERVPDGHVPSPEGHYLQMEPLTDEVVGDVRTPLLVLLGAVAFVLLIACANVGNLLLARAETRQKEIAIRSALGAGRGRLLRQLLTESVLLALLGGAAGLLLGTLGLRALLATSPASLPRVGEVGLDGSVLGFTLGISILTGLLFGLVPGLQVGGRRAALAIREGGDRSTAGVGRQRLRGGLVVGEIALAVVLVIGAGLMLRSFAALQSVNPGFEPEGLLTFRLYLPPSDYPDGAAQAAFYNRLVERLRELPGVTAATAMSGLPPLRSLNANDTEFEGVEQTEDGPPHNVDYYQAVSAGYFDTMGIRVVEGRPFGAQDVGPAAQPVALVNQRLATLFYPGESPLGRRIRPCCGDDGNPWLTVVGVVEDVKQGGLDAETGTELYFFTPQAADLGGFVPRTMNFVARTDVPPASVAGTVRQAVWSIDPGLPIADLQTMGDVLYQSIARPRLLTRLLGTFGALALLLAAVGTYGVMSYTVAERSREMGIRMALGAAASAVQRMVLRQGLGVAAVGLVLGTAAAYGLSRLLASVLYGVSATDTVTFVLVTGLLALVAAAACLIPARRATRVDPMIVLRDS